MSQIIKWALFETRLGDWLLAALERLVGLAVVELESVIKTKPKAD